MLLPLPACGGTRVLHVTDWCHNSEQITPMGASEATGDDLFWNDKHTILYHTEQASNPVLLRGGRGVINELPEVALQRV